MIGISDGQLTRVRAAISAGGMAGRLYAALAKRADAYTAEHGIVTATDSMEWWHVVWERMSDVSFRQRLAPSPERAAWIRTATMALCDRPTDDWVGPFFRPRSAQPSGTLETAHVGLAVVSAATLCGDLFSPAEHEHIAATLREKCQALCERALDHSVAQLEEDPQREGGTDRLNNWFIVRLNGYGTVSAYLCDDAALDKTAELYALATKLFNADSYGETLQYWNYASIHLTHLNEVMLAARPDLAADLDRSCYARCVGWLAQSYLYSKPLAGWGTRDYPRSLNFGDSAATFRPTADVMLHIADRTKAEYPTEAGLARWLFETTFTEVDLDPQDRESFGFFNQFRWPALLSLLDAAPPVTPEEAKLPLTQAFECGTVVTRDSRGNESTVLGIQAGYQPLRVASHRHRDQNSFMLVHRRERIFADPGHCCYRLATQRASVATDAHSTWTFRTEAGDVLEQKPTTGSIDSTQPVLNQLTRLEDLDGISVITSDASAAYGEPVTRAERTWIAALPHVVFIVDRIEATEPVTVRSHFVFNNRDNGLSVNTATPTRLVVRRGGAAAKFFQLASIGDGEDTPGQLERSWGFIHDMYHPQPNQPGQGREGSADIRTFASVHARQYLAIYSIVVDAETAIRGWHVEPVEPRTFRVSPPQGAVLTLSLRPTGSLELVDSASGKALTIDDGATR